MIKLLTSEKMGKGKKMVVNDKIKEEIYHSSNEEMYQAALEYYKKGKVKLEKVFYDNPNELETKGKVFGKKGTYFTKLSIHQGEIENIECTCQDYFSNYGICRHSLATLIELTNRSSEALTEEKGTYRNFRQVLSLFYEQQLEEEQKEKIPLRKIQIVPKILYDKIYGELKLEFRIGEKKLYRIKNLPEFYERMQKQEKYQYGSKLEFIHKEEAFSEESLPLLHFILKQAEIIKYVNNIANTNYRYYGKALNESYFILADTALDEFFEIWKGKKITIKTDSKESSVMLIPGMPEIQFFLRKKQKEEYSITSNLTQYDYQLFSGKQYSYFVKDGFAYRIDSSFQNNILPLLDIFKNNYIKEIPFSKEQLPEFFSLVMPNIKKYVRIEETEKEEIKNYIPEPLVVKVFLDYDKNNYLTAQIQFWYGKNYFNPFNENQKVTIARNILAETESLNLFRRTGFLFDQTEKRLILTNNDSIYTFLTNEIEDYMKRFEVLVTDHFKTKQIKQPTLKGLGVKIENHLLEIDLKQLDLSKEEIQDILKKYKENKKYYRLKDGTFLDLEENPEMEFLHSIQEGMEVDFSKLDNEAIRVPIYRTLYLEKLLKKLNYVPIEKTQTYQKATYDLDYSHSDKQVILPSNLRATLRYYQKVGYQWLKNLEEYGLGGILADDMGLGKTIQILAVILSYVEDTKKENRKPCIVISPSSLSLNWEKEAKRFTPTLKTLVISGTNGERIRKIRQISDYDLVITSYDLLKRDSEKYKQEKISFHYVVADEAQYIKNSSTQNAKTMKEISSDIRFALTGTPIENSLAELWSIFDYIMPGYLFSYRKFRAMYEEPIVKEENEKALKQLKMLIEPFILRRIKKDVLQELPEKSISILNNEMEEEQKNIYLSYLVKAKQEVTEEIQGYGIEKSHIKILALLTRLRQICCHPSLFLDNYEGESGKLLQCMELVKDATQGGHKILIFSSYTSMFEKLEEKLKKEDISYYKLTGQTKVEERVDLVEDFNKNSQVKVFLVSLKAGGTGLNLIGADMVIHYDPWWNLSAENQATDRAYRIGQKNNVQVYKLITKNSIEEKIYELQERKARLADMMLSTEATFISKLSKEEILELFE